MKKAIASAAAPQAIGTYSQAIEAGGMVFLSGQIPLDPATMQLVPGDARAQVNRVFDNLAAVASAAGATLNDMVRVTVYLTDLAQFAVVNEVMMQRFSEPYPARAVVGVQSLPRNAVVEVDAILLKPTR